MENIWTYGILDNQAYPWVPFFCLLGNLLSFWWLRYKLPAIPHSISATAYKNRVLFKEFCLINSSFLGVLYGWESANFSNDLGMFLMLMAALLLPWLGRFWNYEENHRWQHYIIAAFIFGGLGYWSGRLWWVILLAAAISYILSNRQYKIFWSEAVMFHLIILSRIYAYYL